MRYIGGKNQAGTYQRIINLIPPHEIYIEGCLGSGAILRMKRPAAQSFGIDKIDTMFPALDRAAPNLTLIRCDILKWLRNRRWGGAEFVYLDPPYLSSTRGGRRYYKEEMTEPEHKKLLRIIKRIPANVMISGYPSQLYDEELKGWHTVAFTAWTRNHQPRKEVLWMNYPRPRELHDLEYVGSDYRARWNLKKRMKRWQGKLARLDELERRALFAALCAIMERGS